MNSNTDHLLIGFAMRLGMGLRVSRFRGWGRRRGGFVEGKQVEVGLLQLMYNETTEVVSVKVGDH